MLKRIIDATENDKAYFSISDQYLAETEILLEQLNPIRSKSKHLVNKILPLAKNPFTHVKIVKIGK